MAAINYVFKPHKFGVRCTGMVTLSCGYKIQESFVGRTNELCQTAVKDLIEIRVRGHIKTCKEDH